MTQLDFDDRRMFFELAEWREDRELISRVQECIASQREAVAASGKATLPGKATLKGSAQARQEVSPEALERILASGREVKGVASEPEITNAVTFNAPHVPDSFHHGRTRRLRRRLDRAVARRFGSVLRGGRARVLNSGHFWYPPGGYMGWHTNSAHPGWRLYITHAEEPGRSFFRYQDPESGEIVTRMDEAWDFRIFRIDPARPLWHAVYSETNRFSFGFIVRPWSAGAEARLWARRIRRRLGG
jgi:hypothetical protein